MKSNSKSAQRRTRWTAEDRERLKLAVKLARNPRSTADWEWIARQVGGRHTAAECEEEATMNLGWKPPSNGDGNDEAKPFFERISSGSCAVFQRSLDLDPGDSMLVALRSPVRKAKTRRRPFIPKVLNHTILEQGDDSGSSDSEGDDKRGDSAARRMP